MFEDMWANIYSLNKFREMMGFNTFHFRPHSGVGPLEHLSSTFLVAEGINHGVYLTKTPVLEYLYYCAQIGISMSPLGEDALYRSYEKNPFYTFFKRGLNVSLGTDNPLQLHSTNEPLLEEYAVATKMWRLSMCDMSEIARNSVLQSGFEHERKVEWLGPNYNKEGVEKNDVTKSNVSPIRTQFRTQSLQHELSHMQRMVKHNRVGLRKTNE